MVRLIAYQLDAGEGLPWRWEVFDDANPHDPPVAVIEGEEFAGYLADVIADGGVGEIVVRTVGWWS